MFKSKEADFASLPKQLLLGMEQLRRPSGAFIAAAGDKTYEYAWIRDSLWCVLAYLYLGDYENAKSAFSPLQVIFERYQEKLRNGHILHTKYDADRLDEVTENWGHHQVDALGQFLITVGLFESFGIGMPQSLGEILSDLVCYLDRKKYWEADMGMWEEGNNRNEGKPELHSSSIGLALEGLLWMRKLGIVEVPQHMLEYGQKAFDELRLAETRGGRVDLAQLSLIQLGFLQGESAEKVLRRVMQKLVVQRDGDGVIEGVIRYRGDQYTKSEHGSSPWPLGLFKLSTIASMRGEKKAARYWFELGIAQAVKEEMTQGIAALSIPEIIQNGKPVRFPLAWGNAEALIALAHIEGCLP